MQNSSGKDVERSIAEVERRIELRRAQMRQHLEELSQATRERMKPWPLLAIAVFAIAGFTLARSGSAGGSAQATRAVGAAAKTGFLASLIAVIRMAIRLGGSPLVQSGWKFYSGRH